MEDYFKTSDLIQAATLLSYGYKLHNLEKVSDKRYSFVFQPINSANESIDFYNNVFWLKQALIEPTFFYQNVKFLKSLIKNHDNAKSN